MKKILVTGLTMMMAVALLSSCGGNGNKAKETTAEQPQKVVVKTQKASFQDVDNTVELTSNIKAVYDNKIAPASPLRIDKIYVEVGDKVSKGQLLARMDAANYNQTKSNFTVLETNYERIKKVYEAGGISKQELDNIETQLNVSREQLNQLYINTELRSPINGVVTERNYDAGDMYNGSTPVLQVMDISKLKVVVSLSESYFPLTKVGMAAYINVDMYPGKTFDGKVTLISPSIDPASRTFDVEVSIANSKNELRPGMFSRTTIKFGTSKGIVVEDIAVQKQPGSNDKYVFVVENGKAVRKLVTTGRQTGSLINVVSGINEGDEVVVAGMSRLMNGTEVEVKN